MGLFDSVIGAVTQHAAPGDGANPDLMQSVMGLLTGGGEAGAGSALAGLPALIQRFQDAGLASVMHSWISTGTNLPIAPDELGSALGSDTVDGMARQTGLPVDQLLGQLSQFLPQIIDMLTPGGEIPATLPDGFASLGGIGGMIGGLLKRG